MIKRTPTLSFVSETRLISAYVRAKFLFKDVLKKPSCSKDFIKDLIGWKLDRLELIELFSSSPTY